MGSIFRRKNSTGWQLKWDVGKDKFGTRLQRSKVVHGTREDAEAEMERILSVCHYISPRAARQEARDGETCPGCHRHRSYTEFAAHPSALCIPCVQYRIGEWMSDPGKGRVIVVCPHCFIPFLVSDADSATAASREAHNWHECHTNILGILCARDMNCPHCHRAWYCPCRMQWSDDGVLGCPTCQIYAPQGNQGPTWIEQELSRILDQMRVHHSAQHPIYGTPYVADEYLPEANLLIEALGDYWHSLPDTQQKDTLRRRLLRKRGYRLCEISESEFRNDQTVRQRIRAAVFRRKQWHFPALPMPVKRGATIGRL
jgi:very-short-patch-repair endonuclease